MVGDVVAIAADAFGVAVWAVDKDDFLLLVRMLLLLMLHRCCCCCRLTLLLPLLLHSINSKIRSEVTTRYETSIFGTSQKTNHLVLLRLFLILLNLFG